MTLKKVNLRNVIGTVHIISKTNKKRKITAKIPKTVEEAKNQEIVSLKDGDEIITEKNSYVLNITDEHPEGINTTCMGPESRAIFRVKGKVIKKITIKQGLFFFLSPTPLEVPLFNVTPIVNTHFVGFLDCTKGQTTIAVRSPPMNITHKNTGESVEMPANRQISATPKQLPKEPERISQKYHDFYAKFEENQKNIIKLIQKSFEGSLGIHVEHGEEHIIKTKETIKEMKKQGKSTKFIESELEIYENYNENVKEEMKQEKIKRKQDKKQEKQRAQERDKFDAQQQNFNEELAKLGEKIQPIPRIEDIMENRQKTQNNKEKSKSKSKNKEPGDMDEQQKRLEEKLRKLGLDV